MLLRCFHNQLWPWPQGCASETVSDRGQADNEGHEAADRLRFDEELEHAEMRHQFVF